MSKKLVLKIIVAAITAIVIIILVFLFLQNIFPSSFISPIGKGTQQPKEKTLEKYSFDTLRTRIYTPSNIQFLDVLKKEDDFTSYLFTYTSDGKKVSGLANIPNDGGRYPVIVLLRGFVDRSIYETGIGTKRTGEVFAKNGFITLAPDFLGYGQSASPSANTIEERFETYTTAHNLLASVKNLSSGLSTISSASAYINKIGIWGHSNGGHIALSILEQSGKNYPTVLWAPVTKPFPFSVLYFTDEFEDNGKALRKVIANFEDDYDIEKYSLTNYLDWIKAPIQLHQGGADNDVPQKWSDQFVVKMKKLRKDITYFTYPGNDHNLFPDAWSVAISRSMEFYRKEFAKKENP